MLAHGKVVCTTASSENDDFVIDDAQNDSSGIFTVYNRGDAADETNFYK